MPVIHREMLSDLVFADYQCIGWAFSCFYFISAYFIKYTCSVSGRSINILTAKIKCATHTKSLTCDHAFSCIAFLRFVGWSMPILLKIP